MSQLLYLFVSDTQPSANNTCGDIEVKTPDLLFYERNVTITFRPAKNTTDSPQLIDAANPQLSYKHDHHDKETNVFTFILLSNRTAKRSQDYYVQYKDGCSSGAIRFQLRGL